MNDFEHIQTMHRLLAATNIVAVILMSMVAGVLLWRRMTRPERTPLGRDEVDIDEVLTAQAVILLGIASRFGLSSGILLGYWPGNSTDVVALRLALVLVVIAASLVAVRAATLPIFGNRVTYVLGGISAAGALALYFFG